MLLNRDREVNSWYYQTLNSKPYFACIISKAETGVLFTV